MTTPALVALVAIVLVGVASAAIGSYGVRVVRSTSDFLVASRTVGHFSNASAISGEYLSAASFLGIAGLILREGADALWYPIAFVAGYLALLLFVVAPLRRSGAYTVPDFAEVRLDSRVLRLVCTVFVLVIGWLYLLPQLQGAGLALTTLTPLPAWSGVAAVGVIVLLTVIGGGMRSITFVQAFQYWLKVSALAVPALVVLGLFLSDTRSFDRPAPPQFPEDTVVQVRTDVVLAVAGPASVGIEGDVDGRPVSGETMWQPGRYEVGAGTTLAFAAGTAVPTVAGTPATDREWLEPMGGDADNQLLEIYSILIAGFLGTMGLPHVLVRFYTNADGRAARRTTVVVLAMIGSFYMLVTLVGALSRLYTPQLLVSGNTDAAVLLVPIAALGNGWAGWLLGGLVAAGAAAAFLATSSGIVVSLAGVLFTDVLRGRMHDFRLAAVVATLPPLAFALLVDRLDFALTVPLVFAVAASTFCPLLLLGIWWRGLTAKGAIAGVLVGGGLSGVAVGITMFAEVPPGWLGVLLLRPSAITVPAAFLTMFVVSRLTRSEIPADVDRSLLLLHAPERLGVVKDRRGRSHPGDDENDDVVLGRARWDSGTVTTASLTALVAMVAVAAASAVIGGLGVRFARSTSDFFVASRTVGPAANAGAISGEYLSAASFLGIAGLILRDGVDALWYPVGFTAGYLALVLFVSAPLRRSGAYTVPDFAEARLRSALLRNVCTAFVIVIGWLYLLPQLQGAGLTLATVTGLPSWIGAVAAAVVVVATVVLGGMRSITFVQVFQYWLKLTALALPAVMALIFFLSDNRTFDREAPPQFPDQATVDVRTDVVLDVRIPVSLVATGEVDGVAVNGATVRWDVGEHTVAADSELVFPSGSAVPVVAGAPATDARWLMPYASDTEHGLLGTYSLIIALFLGTMGLPHVLVRFYTNPDGRAARRSAVIVLAMLGGFYAVVTLLGALSRLYTPQLLVSGDTDAAVLLLPAAVLGSGWAGAMLGALVAAGAWAAFLSTSSGLVVSIAGVLSTDVLRSSRVRDFRIAAVIAGAVPIVLSVIVTRLDFSEAVALVFAVAASTFCPLLLLGIWWRGLTPPGAIVGVLVGGVSSAAAVAVSLLGLGGSGWIGVLLYRPAIVTVPAAFLAMVVVSKFTPKQRPPDTDQVMLRLHAPERLGLGRDRLDERMQRPGG